MEEYVKAFNSGTSLSSTCDLTGLYCRVSRGLIEDDYSQTLQNPARRLSWISGHETLRKLVGMSHLDILFNQGFTSEWIQVQLNDKRIFKLIVFSLPQDEVKIATWDNIFKLLEKFYPEIDSSIWSRYSKQLKEMTFEEIDPEQTIVKNYYLGPESDGFMTLDRLLSMKDEPTLIQVRAFLFHHVCLNELFGGNGQTVSHEGVLLDTEYLTANRSLNQLDQCVMLPLNPIVP